MDVLNDLSPLSPGLIDELEAFMGPVGDGCYGQPLDARRIGSHQLPESPPDSGSENPYSPSDNQVPHAISVSQTVLGPDYMIVHDHLPTHEILQQNGDYIYEELKSDNIDQEVLRNNLNEVVVLPQDPNIVDLGIRAVRHDLGLAESLYQNRYSPMRVDMQELEQGIINQQIVTLGHDALPPVYTNLQEPNPKKRKQSQDVNSQVKCEPAALSPDSIPQTRPAPPSVDGSEAGDDVPQQCIRFACFQQSSWHMLYDCNLKPLPSPSYVVGADKGFNFSQIDEAFVCQKKNHFQVTCQIQVQGEPHYVKTGDGFKKINNFFLHFYGVKELNPLQPERALLQQVHDCYSSVSLCNQAVTVVRLLEKCPLRLQMDIALQPSCNSQAPAGAVPAPVAKGYLHGYLHEDPSQEVRIEQSQSDRTKKPFHPVPVELRREGTKVTIGRLHFAETTNNNMRKKGRPNPDQRHFQLVVGLRAHVSSAECMVAAQASDRIIVRASNPGQFESDCTESWWQRGVSDNSVHFTGRVGINTDRPDESCVIHGNLKVMGHIVHPSDARAKQNIEELDTAEQLRNVQKIRVVKFNYDRQFAAHSGLLGVDPAGTAAADTGVIAQELRRVLPDAVREAGDVALPDGHTIPRFLLVNKDRIFMENLGAVKELCKVTGNLESRINQLERINKKLCKINILQRRDSSRSCVSNDSRFSGLSNSSKSLHSEGNVSTDQIRDIARNIRKHECCHKLSHNSPKYTRKQCKNCHGSYSKYGKYYNYNKTSVRYNAKDQKGDEKSESHYATYIEPCDAKTEKLPEDNYSTASKKKDTCLWLKNDNYEYGNSRLAFCCRRKDSFGDGSGEFISNKFLQIIITILIFIMAVCLVAMSALYFREHQELLNMKEIRMQEKFTNYPHYGKFNVNTPLHRTPPDQNQIQNLKPSQHIASKKTVKEKGPHKTTPEYSSTTSETLHTAPTTLHASRNYVRNVLHMEQTSVPPLDRPVSLSRISNVIGGGCSFTMNADNELDAECQSSCGLDSPQTYENQEPLEKPNPEKEQNETYTRPLDPSLKENLPIIPVIPDKNITEVLKTENDSLKSHIHDEIVAESNFLDPTKQNGTDTGNGRLKRDERFKRSVRKRETNEALLRSSSEEMTLTEQSDEIALAQECDTITVGISSKSINNASVFTETFCPRAVHNFTYAVPLSHCLHHKHLDVTFRSTKLKEIRLCDLRCKYDTPKNCQLNREMAKPVPSGGSWTSKMNLECNMDRYLKIRGGFTPLKDVCYLTPDSKQVFVEFNIHIYRDCHN